MINSERLMEDLEKVIDDARLSKSELNPIVQPIFMDKVSSDDLILMEMNSDLLHQIEENKILTIRGDPNDPAVICGLSKTYEIKEAETSNSVLVIPHLIYPEDCKESNEMSKDTLYPREVLTIFNSYYEAKPCIPKLKKLRELLEINPYKGQEYEDETKSKFTFNNLLDLVQASEDEIQAELLKMHTCEIDGYIRQLEFFYKFHAFSHIRDTIDAESIPFDQIPKKYIISLLTDLYPKEILNKIFTWYAVETNTCDKDGNVLFSLNEEEVCKLYAEIYIKPAHSVNREDFLKNWQIAVPKGMTTRVEFLKGWTISLLDRSPQIIFYYPVETLPDDINNRFKKLFATKPKWTFEEIEPYLKEYEAAGLNVKTLLTKYTRSSVQDGIKVHSSKW